MGTSGNPIDTANDALIYLFLASKIRVERINKRDRVNWVTRAIIIHISYLVYCLEGEAKGGELC